MVSPDDDLNEQSDFHRYISQRRAKQRALSVCFVFSGYGCWLVESIFLACPPVHLFWLGCRLAYSNIIIHLCRLLYPIFHSHP